MIVPMKKLIPYSPPSATTRFFLVVLRLAIGWHLFVEGVTKLETFYTGPTGTSKPFSSRGYLQQSQGPLAPLFRGMAGDPDEQLLLRLKHDPGRLPVVLEKQWRDFSIATFAIMEFPESKNKRPRPFWRSTCSS